MLDTDMREINVFLLPLWIALVLPIVYPLLIIWSISRLFFKVECFNCERKFYLWQLTYKSGYYDDFDYECSQCEKEGY